jgi:hypothetical protein
LHGLYTIRDLDQLAGCRFRVGQGIYEFHLYALQSRSISGLVPLGWQ